MRKGRSRRKTRGARPKANASAINQITAVTSPADRRGGVSAAEVVAPEVVRPDAVASDAVAREAFADAAAMAPSDSAPPSEPVSADGVAVRDVRMGSEPPPADEREDDLSIPPVGDLVVEEFFSEGDLSRHATEDEDAARVDERIARKHAPHVVQRRARFARYVTWAVAGAAAVCVAALVRTAVTGDEPTGFAEPRAATLAVEAPFGDDLPLPAETVQPAPEQAPAEPAPEPHASAAATGAEQGPEAAPSATAPALEEAGATAAEEKTTARRALERGNLSAAIAAGERSVALDPEDGESWLILGASYQEKGRRADARRCYASCAKEAKRGPIAECRAMLR
jgi:hypothetical protein